MVRKDTASVLKVNEAWALLQNAITQTADTVLDRTERVTHKDWLDAECEQATTSKNWLDEACEQATTSKNWLDAECEQATTSKNCAYKKCNKEIVHGNQWRNTELPELREKRVHKQKKKIFIERGVEEFERLRSNNENKSIKS